MFFDKDSIQGGEVFSERIESAVRDCRVLVALISRDWLTVKDARGRPRLENPDDLVRREIALALELGKPVIPVLYEVEQQEMPGRDNLPAPLQALADKDFFTLRGKVFEYRTQLTRLIELLAAVPGVPAPVPTDDARGGVLPDKLPYLCDRSEQQSVVRDAVRTHLRERPRRPLVLVVHGRSNEAHGAFIDRLAALELPRLTIAAALAGKLRFLWIKQALNFTLDDEGFARELRDRVTAEMQIEYLERDEDLCERLARAKLGGIVPVLTVTSEELKADAAAALRQLFDYWAKFPDAPPRTLVCCLLCVMYEPPRSGLLGRWFGGRPDERMRQAVEQTAKALESAAQATWKTVPELESVRFSHFQIWATGDDVRAAMKRNLEFTVTLLKQRFGEHDPIPMDDAIEKMRELLREPQNG